MQFPLHQSDVRDKMIQVEIGIRGLYRAKIQEMIRSMVTGTYRKAEIMGNFVEYREM